MSYAQHIDYAAIAPPLVVLAAAAAALLADLVTPRCRRFLPAVAVAGLLGALLAVALLAAGEDRGSFCGPDACSFAADRFTLAFQGLFCLAGVVVALLCAPVVVRERIPAGEFWFLLLVSFAGMLTLAGARDLVVLLLALEVVSLPAFVLVGLRRADPRASEAALKFFLFSVISTAVTVYGMSLFYGTTGTLQLGVPVAVAPAAEPVHLAAAGLIATGFAFKASVVPFHFWAPDTYAGAPVPVAAYLSVASKAAGFAGLVIVLAAVGDSGAVRPVLGALAAATMTVGNLTALRQRNVVRLLAWSSVAQAGYMLVPLATTKPDATLVYVGAYAAMNLGAFGCAAAVALTRPRQSVEDYRGLVSSSPVLALALAFFLTALAGLPPGLLGLIAKVVVFRAAVTGGAAWLAVVMAANTVIALYYYARLAALLFESGPRRARLGVPAPTAAAVGVTAAAAVVLGFWPQALLAAVPSFR
jgi:NADH-quinone oxidoreductase subunit N